MAELMQIGKRKFVIWIIGSFQLGVLVGFHLISDLVMKIEKLVKSCHTLEASLGGLMDKTAILTFATKVIDVITAELDDEVILAKVSNGILRVVGEMGQNEQ